MQTRDVVGFVLVPLVMLLAVLFSNVPLFDQQSGLPAFLWLLRQIAYSLLIVGATALLCQCSPGQIPLRTILSVWITLCLLLIGKLLLDFTAPFAESPAIGPTRRRDTEEALLFDLPNLVLFVLVLLGTFLVPRSARSRINASGGNPRDPIVIEDR